MTEDYHDNPMTKEEEKVLAEVLEEFETHFVPGELKKLEMFEYNDDYVDLQLTYSDGYEESMAFERDLLTSGKSIEQIIDWIS